MPDDCLCQDCHPAALSDEELTKIEDDAITMSGYVDGGRDSRIILRLIDELRRVKATANG